MPNPTQKRRNAGKRILIVGAGYSQLPLIQLAKQEGHFVITSDYLPDNPGHKLADESHSVSTLDKALMLALAKDLEIDGIATLSSDPIMPTVAYVAQHLGLPGPSVDSIAILTQKNLFRQALKKIGLNTPNVYLSDGTSVPDNLAENAQYVVKPVDSCGSKGITLSSGSRMQIESAIRQALEFSVSGRVIIEDYIDGPQLHGDGFMTNGRLVHAYLGDHEFYTKTNSFVPIATLWPSRHGEEIINEIKSQVEQVSREAGYLTGPLNIEARVSKDQKVYLVEIGPRSGGNFAPISQEKLTGFNYLKAELDYALGQLDLALVTPTSPLALPGAYFILHSNKNGTYAGLEISAKIKKNIFFLRELKKPGEAVEQCTGSHTTLGVALLEFNSISERDEIMGNIQNHIAIKLDSRCEAKANHSRGVCIQ